MFKVKIGVLLAAVIAVFAVSVAPAMAFKNFVAKAGMGQIKGKSLTTQVFTTKFGTIECKVANASGAVTAEKTTTQELEFKYPTAAKNCLIFGFVEATISPEKYTFNINGEVTLNNEVKVETTGCKLIVGAGQNFAANQVKYKNNGNNLKGLAAVKGIKYVGKGSTCEGSAENGEYKGEEELAGNNPPTTVNVE
jgi:hypothetical protein